MPARMDGTDRGGKAPARPRNVGKRPARRIPGAGTRKRCGTASTKAVNLRGELPETSMKISLGGFGIGDGPDAQPQARATPPWCEPDDEPPIEPGRIICAKSAVTSLSRTHSRPGRPIRRAPPRPRR